MVTDIRQLIQCSIDTKQLILKDELLLNAIRKAAEVSVNAFGSGNKVLFCGNGGSAADAQHIAAELSGRFILIVAS